MKRLLLCTGLHTGMLLLVQPLAATAQSLTIKAVDSKTSLFQESLEARLRSWRLYQLTAPIDEPSLATQSIVLQLGEREVLLTGAHHPLTGDDSRLVALGETGRREMKFPRLLHFKGDRGRLTIGKEFILGEFSENGSSYVIEGLGNLVPGAHASWVAVYRPTDVIVDKPRRCAVEELPAELPSSTTRSNIAHENEHTTESCRVVEIAVLANSEVYKSHQSSLEQTAAYIASIYLLTEGDFTGQFNDDLKFKIVEMVISTSEDSDPWEWFLDLDLDITFGLFAAWAQENLQSPNDLSSYWFNDGLIGGYIGYAELGQTCHVKGDAVIREQTYGAQYMRCLLSHEHGHNFNAPHDVDGGQFIMQPIINAGAYEFSSVSRQAINVHLASPATRCITDCPSAVCDESGPLDLSVRYDPALRSIQCSWRKEAGVAGYEVHWKLFGDTAAYSGTAAATDTLFSIPVPPGPICQAYSVQVAKICQDGLPGLFIGSPKIVVGYLPLPVISVSNDTLYSSVSFGNQWFLDNKSIPGATGSSYKPSITGSYSVQMSLNGCQSLSAPYYFYVNRPQDPGLPSRFVFAPNPVPDYLRIWYPGTSVPLTLTVYDMTGRRMLQQHYSTASLQVDMRKFSAGIYMVQVVLDYSGQQIKRTVVKQ